MCEGIHDIDRMSSQSLSRYKCTGEPESESYRCESESASLF